MANLQRGYGHEVCDVVERLWTREVLVVVDRLQAAGSMQLDSSARHPALRNLGDTRLDVISQG